MKKLIIIIFLLALSRSAIADFSGADNKNALDSIVKIAEARSSSLNSAYVFRYNVNRFSAEKTGAELVNDHENKMLNEGKRCSYRFLIGSPENIAALRTDRINKELSDKIAEQLEDLDEQGQLITIVSALWDGKNGSSELCSAYEFNAFSVDGYKLILEFK